MAETLDLSEDAKMETVSRAEIDTSAPFESVKEAASRFGGIGFWKPTNIAKISQPHKSESEALDIVKLEEQTLFLEKDLILKERETLDVLKELEKTKTIMEDLKQKLQKEASELSQTLDPDKNSTHCSSSSSSSPPNLILMELKQAKLNLTRTTTDLADIRSSVDSFNKKLENERLALESTRERLTQNSSKITSLEEELSQTKRKLQESSGNSRRDDADDPIGVSRELQRLSSEVEQFKSVGEAARAEVSRAAREIEQTKTRIKTAEARLVAARKMKEAAQAAEAVALAEIKAISSSSAPNDGVTLSLEEYSSLVRRARDAEEAGEKRAADALQKVDEADISRTEILKRVEEATEEVKTSKKALEEALSRVGEANRGKLAVEEALRKWRSDNGQRRRSSVNNSAKFKNSCPISHQRRDSRLIDVNGLNLVSDGSGGPVLRPTLSIGQILSRKLLPPEDLVEPRGSGKNVMRPKVSLGQMLSKKNNGDVHSSLSRPDKENIGHKQFSGGKRKKFGFGRFSVLLAKQNKKKKKKTSLNLR